MRRLRIRTHFRLTRIKNLFQRVTDAGPLDWSNWALVLGREHTHSRWTVKTQLFVLGHMVMTSTKIKSRAS